MRLLTLRSAPLHVEWRSVTVAASKALFCWSSLVPNCGGGGVGRGMEVGVREVMGRGRDAAKFMIFNSTQVKKV